MIPLLLLLPGMFSELIAEPVAVVEIHGAIGDDVDVRGLVDIFESVEEGDYAAMILDIDSPGGTAVDSHRIVKALEDFEKPTVALIGNAGVSGAYWVAVSCDHLVADELSFVGSIGASSRFVNLEGLAEKLGVDAGLVVYPENKSFGTPFRGMSPAEKEYSQELVDSAGMFFVDSVVGMRPEAEAYADGLPYVAYEAPELVDGFGDLDDAVEAAERLTGKNLVAEKIGTPMGFMDIFQSIRRLGTEGPFNLFELFFEVPYYF